jgi:tRNA(Ile)-lysidine synthase
LSLLQHFQWHIQQHQLLKREGRYLLACSGGVDSMVLLDLCVHSNITFDLAHVNYGLRGEDSDWDEQLVLETAAQRGIFCHQTKYPEGHRVGESGFNLQEQARNFRYHWFDTLRDHQGNAYAGVLTAHHGSDQTETVLKNLFFGTGLSGLTGISFLMTPQSGLARIRPLLFSTKSELLQYATGHQLVWREDASNLKEDYLRNSIRKNLISNFINKIPQLENNIISTTERLRQTEHFVAAQVRSWVSRFGRKKPGESRLPIRALQNSDGFMVLLDAWLKPVGFSYAQVEAVARLMDSVNGRMIESDTHRVVRDRHWLVCLEKNNELPIIQWIDLECRELEFEMGRLDIQVLSTFNPLLRGAETAQLNHASLEFPLKLRPWRAGDYFYPLGMPKKKKVSRLLIDLKLTPLEKEKVWILESGSRICWVVGLRIDHRFKVDENSSKILKINFLRN